MSVAGSVVLLTILSLAAGQDQHCSAQPVVATREGALRGLAARSAAGRLYYAFRGIPYAQAPVADLRFESPQRHHGWSGIRDATEIGSSCLQYNIINGGALEGDEDCLFANVYTPHLPQGVSGGGAGTALLPVMVWIHGGGFNLGSGDDQFYGPQLLVDGGVVLVAINYRLNVFGFLTTDDATAPGNYGLMDQVLALQWVRDNIAVFGGNPQLVTIFGESAGGGSVSALVLSPLTRGLFQHAITQSGSILAAWSGGRKRFNSAAKVASKVNCTDHTQLMACLRSIPALDLIEATQKFDPYELIFLPRLDVERENALLPEDPRMTLKSGRFNLVPWMHGMTAEEGGLFVSQYLMDDEKVSRITEGDLEEWRTAALMLPAVARFECGVDSLQETARVRDFYLNDSAQPISKENILPLVKMMGDRIVNVATTEESRLASAHAPVYKFVLDHIGPGRHRLDGLFGMSLPDDFPPMHGEDMTYLFKWRNESLAAADSPEYAMQRFMVDIWTNFARTGRPYTDLFNMPDWPIFTERQQRHMRLNSDPSVAEDAFEERVDFWHTIPLVEPWRTSLSDEQC